MKKIFPFLFMLLCCHELTAQTTGDYRSISSGNWSNTSSWERYNGATWINPAPSAPTSTDGIITIRDENTITINSDITTDETVVEAGATLVLQASTLGIANGSGDDIIINGNFIFISGQIAGSGIINVTGSMDWKSGFLRSNIILAAGSHS